MAFLPDLVFCLVNVGKCLIEFTRVLFGWITGSHEVRGSNPLGSTTKPQVRRSND